MARLALVPATPVILNLFQDPCEPRSTSVTSLGEGRAWMLKQVQHDGVSITEVSHG